MIIIFVVYYFYDGRSTLLNISLHHGRQFFLHWQPPNDRKVQILNPKYNGKHGKRYKWLWINDDWWYSCISMWIILICLTRKPRNFAGPQHNDLAQTGAAGCEGQGGPVRPGPETCTGHCVERIKIISYHYLIICLIINWSLSFVTVFFKAHHSI